MLVGVFIKTLPIGGLEYMFGKKCRKKIQVESRKLSGDSLEASEITNIVCLFLTKFFKCPVSFTYHSGNSLYWEYDAKKSTELELMKVVHLTCHCSQMTTRTMRLTWSQDLGQIPLSLAVIWKPSADLLTYPIPMN